VRRVTIKEIEAKSVLRKHKKIDSWFVSRYGMNLYRGCLHGCVYCDGRAEGYYVEGEFGKDISIKTNALEVLRRELDPKRRRVPLRPGFLMMGGGVGDSYQPVEEQYRLTRGALELACEFGFPVHMLTKSTLIERDIDLLTQINRQHRAIVSFSFSSVDDDLSALFEPHVPPPSARLATLARLKREGLPCGMFLLPVIPFLTDTRGLMDDAVRCASEVGLDFIIFGGMTLKEGRQKTHFLAMLERNDPELVEKYRRLYPGDKWGGAAGRYYDEINTVFAQVAGKYDMPKRVPLSLYQDILDENDLVVVLLEQMDYLLKLEGEKSPLGYAAYSLSQVKLPLSTIKQELRKLRGISNATEEIVLEILDSRSSTLYEQLMAD
jgi:DNA repair photolyase